MQHYEQYSKEELIHRIIELEVQIEKLSQTNLLKENITPCFKEKYGSEVLEILPDMLSVFDHDCNFVALVSSEKTVHVGTTSENLLGKNLLDILPTDAYNPVKENFDKVISTGQASIGYHNLHVNGVLEHFENRVIPLNDRHILCICRNITDTVKAQNQLQMVTSAINNSIEEIYATDISGSIIFANKRFINLYQIEDSPSNYRIHDIFSDATEEIWKKHINWLKEYGGTHNHTIIHTLANGRQTTREISAYILKDNSGNEIIWTIARDISERIERESKIYELNKLTETILNNIPVYLFVKDTGDNFRYVYWNKEFEQKSHIPASFAIGKTDAEIFPNSQDAEKFRRDDLQLLKEKRTIDYEEDYTTITNERRIVQTIKTLIPLESKAPLLIGISWDITDQKRTEKELIKARIKAEESDKLKSSFLANMSHEIRTPLNAIVGFSKLMAEIENTEERVQYADIIDKNTELLLQLINDILDLSKIEAGILEFTEKPVNLNQLCQGIFETHLPRTAPGVQLIYDPAPETITTLSDGNRLAQVISNLLSNAQKFTSKGEIRIGFRQKGQWIEFFVKDTGTGIPKDYVDKIFIRFVKLNTFIQGTGLGLAICRMIIENIGGEIQVESEENVGTEFRFTIPYHKVEPASDESQKINNNVYTVANQQRTILIAEDVESNFLLLKSLLRKKYQLFHALNGQEAIELFKSCSPNLILMDLKMPEMDGLESTRKIRKISTEIPIIALTAFAFESDRNAALEAGCNDFLTKPISSALLTQTIEKYI